MTQRFTEGSKNYDSKTNWKLTQKGTIFIWMDFAKIQYKGVKI